MSRLASIRKGRSVWTKISGGRGRPWEIFFGFYEPRHILLSDSANCTVLHAVVLTQYRRVTDRRTALASTALAVRALGRAVKTWTPVLCVIDNRTQSDTHQRQHNWQALSAVLMLVNAVFTFQFHTDRNLLCQSNQWHSHSSDEIKCPRNENVAQ